MATLRSPAPKRVAPTPEHVKDGTAKPRQRDPWFDNAKMILIVLVVVGHTWAQLPTGTANAWAYDFLYAWHMPAFVIVTGYLSRSMTWEPAKVWALFCTVAVPYLIFESALIVLKRALGEEPLADALLVPRSPMWFLVALVAWRLATPLFVRLPRLHALGAALAISLLAGLIAGDTLSVARILGFLPFFVLGLRLRRDDWDALRSKIPWQAAVGGFAAILALARFTDDLVGTDWLYYDASYAELGEGPVSGAAIRLTLIALAVLGSVCLFALVPCRRTWFSSLGAATLIVYLFHDFFVVALGYSSIPSMFEGYPLLTLGVSSVAAVALALVLATPPVVRLLTPLADPVGRLERRRDQAPRSG